MKDEQAVAIIAAILFSGDVLAGYVSDIERAIRKESGESWTVSVEECTGKARDFLAAARKEGTP